MKNRFHSRLRCPHDDYATSDLIGQNTAFPFFFGYNGCAVAKISNGNALYRPCWGRSFFSPRFQSLTARLVRGNWRRDGSLDT